MPGRPLTPTDLDRLATLDTMDIVGIEVWAHHGVFAQERQEGQPFRVDVTWWQDMRQASHTDDVAHAIDYAQVADLVVEVVKGSPVDLIETLAYRVQETLLARFPMDCVQICVHKPQAPLSASVTDVLVTTAPRTHTPPGSQGRAAADGLRPDQAARLSPNPPIHCCSAPPYGHPGPIATAQQTSSLPSRCRCAQCTHLVALA
ncbi:MAG: dihydroneopterin aldolase, partial [Propionibacteriaceae bacterium]|nr:dihydroneopterin aldolase [Propionibacteriaceae bacterium]